MLKSHEKFYSANGKRLVLVGDDEMINREIMGALLANDYEVIYAADGGEALERIRENSELLSLVLLDLLMPRVNGFEVLRQVREHPDLRHIPIIVITSDQKSEVESLTLGAIDFIPKPFPDPGVVLARVRRTIELSEDRMIISSTERDPLTELYNREYFYQYAERFDQHHRDMPMDAIVIDIYHFHTINERFGTAYGDKVLRVIAARLRTAVNELGGIVCRREADTFLAYLPHGCDYAALLTTAAEGFGEFAVNSRIRLRMGVYEKVNKELPVERRFDRANIAAEKIKNSFSGNIGIYDSSMHEKELYAEQLMEDFHTAIAEEQFLVYYQPKYDVRAKTPVLTSAEALVRWLHPKLGMISPAEFIPLFEDNGLIQPLDRYVWHKAASQIADWEKRLGFSVPVSVNVSRVDMYDQRLAEEFSRILRDNGISSADLLLEITESAYTEDSAQMIDMVQELRRLGFRIEMDDFGTGYSSLNMISSLPIDALKLDMHFIRQAFSKRRDTRLLEVIIEIADYLGVPVIAEGVETEEQLLALKAMGCDIVQGYYFSKPVPADAFEAFVVERKKQVEEERRHRITFASIAQALSQDYFCIYYIDTQDDSFIEYSAHEDYINLAIEKNGVDFFAVSRKNAPRVIHPDDLDMFLSAFTRDKVMEELEHSRTFTLTYRLMLNQKPTYVHLKATRMESKTFDHFVIGISNIDEQMRREQEYARILQMANQDALTGFKSKHAFAEAEHKLDRDISAGVALPFALAVCDVNGLKHINDTYGHQVGDAFIKRACFVICEVFRHSEVYRIGGDEFAVLITDADYTNRAQLLERMQRYNQSAGKEDAAIACGMADFDPEEDSAVSIVLHRADKAMYDNKKALTKGGETL